MDIGAYTDGIIDLLEKAGVPEEEYLREDAAGNNVYSLAGHCHMKGYPFKKAATAILKRFNVAVKK